VSYDHCVCDRQYVICDRTGEIKAKPPLKKEISCPEYEMVPSINKNTKTTVHEKDFVEMEKNPAYGVSMSIQTTMKDAGDAVKIQDNPAYDVTNYNKL